MSGTSGNDSMVGTGSADTRDGLGGDDVVSGLNGDDLLRGSAGNDTLIGGAGADTLNGGTGRDRASYQTAAAGIVVALAGELGTTGEAAGDLLQEIEDLLGSAFADSLVGSATDNAVEGGDGADTLDGGAGPDTLLGGAGDDVLLGDAGTDPAAADRGVGGTGLDTFSYATAETLAGVGAGASLLEGGFAGIALGDTYSGIENLEGSALADTLIGDGLANLLSGLAGADLLAGLNGADTLLGAEGADSLSGGNGNDRLDGGTGADTMRGGVGDDTYVVDSSADRMLEAAGAGSDTLITSVSYTVPNAVAIETIVLQYEGLLAVIASGNSGANRIIGNPLNNVLNGGAGRDTLIGGLGNDSLRGNNDDDRLEGGAGNDRLDGGQGWDIIASPFALDEVELLRQSATVIRLTDPTGLDTLVSIEGFELDGVLWKVAPAVIPIGAATPYDVRTTRLDGPAGSGFGAVVGAAGDVDGDGRPDLIVGSGTLNGGDGGAWLVWGKAGGFGANWTFGDGSVRFLGPAGEGGAAGTWVGGFGDTDGDGYADFGISAPLLPFIEQDAVVKPSDGIVSLVRGRSKGDFALSDGSVRSITDGTSNTVLLGETPTGKVGGIAVGAGDLNGDGLADIGIGGTAASGYVSILLGSTGRPKQIGLGDGSVTKISTSASGIEQGTALGGGGDVNGDGYDDLVIGSRGVNGGAGGAWVLLGKEAGWGGTQTLGGAGFVTISPTTVGDALGSGVTVIGDWNGDGFDDFALGAPGNNGARGSVFIVSGRAAFGSPLNLATDPGVVRFNGVEALDGAGRRLSGAGDVNGDGFDDLLVGGGNGDTWLVLGRAGGAAVQTLATAGVIKFEGADGSFGLTVSGVGDVDGDGLDDLLIGGQTGFDAGAGAAWLVYGDHWLGI